MGEDKPPRYTDDRIPVTMIIDLRDGTSKAQTVAIKVDSTDKECSELLVKTFNDLVIHWKKSKRVPTEGISPEGFEQEYEV